MRPLTGQAKRHLVLVVDDEPAICGALVRVLERHGFDAVAVPDVEEARVAVATLDVSLAIIDVHLGAGSGLDLLEALRCERPDVAAIIISGSDADASVARALELGVYGYVLKPFAVSQLLVSVRNAVRRRELETDARHEAHVESIRRLARVVEYRDSATGQHVTRMARFAGELGMMLGLDRQSVELATSLHDVGKIAIPDALLLKPGPLAADEVTTMQTHTTVGHEILCGSGVALLEEAASIALSHHERFDGQGYPHGLAGTDIPLPSRIAAVTDVFDALVSDRPYRAAMTPAAAGEVMRADAGHFDPDVLAAFAALPALAEHRLLG